MNQTECHVCAGQTEALFVKDGYPIRRCGPCGFMFVSPFPTPEDIRAFYGNNYRNSSGDHYPKAVSRRRRAFGRALRLAPWLIGRSVLELGCGGGFMTDAMRRYATRAVGMDISPGSIAYARDHFPRCEFRAETLADAAARGERYGFVFSSELFEHLAGVDEVMDCLSRVSAPNGLVYVATPDASHPKVPRPLEAWGDICPPEHLQWFSRESLTRLFRRHGFEPHRFLRNLKPAHAALFRNAG